MGTCWDLFWWASDGDVLGPVYGASDGDLLEGGCGSFRLGLVEAGLRAGAGTGGSVFGGGPLVETRPMYTEKNLLVARSTFCCNENSTFSDHKTVFWTNLQVSVETPLSLRKGLVNKVNRPRLCDFFSFPQKCHAFERMYIKCMWNVSVMHVKRLWNYCGKYPECTVRNPGMYMERKRL